ncbi:MAG: triose-phosphate isomerase [Gammaproteobacteria bacterium]|jgi:triosephosphate isomerase|nr:triose-phosphate isomerase [Gammaproteobacteria bacterium]
MRKGLIAANWKMNGQEESNEALLSEILEALHGLSAHENAQTEILICPPALYLQQVGKKLEGSQLKLGAQNVHPAESGAFTGEISAQMLRDVKCSHVIIGHSERREIFGEDDQFIAEKFSAAQASDLIPVLCVGETQALREAGETSEAVLGQLKAVLNHAGVDAFKNSVIAYEPVWAIGTGLTASPEQAQEVHALIRATISELDTGVGEQIKIIYGGSVKSTNAAELFAQQDIDGALVGGASLVAEEFVSIWSAYCSN